MYDILNKLNSLSSSNTKQLNEGAIDDLRDKQALEKDEYEFGDSPESALRTVPGKAYGAGNEEPEEELDEGWESGPDEGSRTPRNQDPDYADHERDYGITEGAGSYIEQFLADYDINASVDSSGIVHVDPHDVELARDLLTNEGHADEVVGDLNVDQVAEAAKPDFLNVDKDGNKKESFKKAVKDKKAVTEGQKSWQKMNRLEKRALRGGWDDVMYTPDKKTVKPVSQNPHGPDEQDLHDAYEQGYRSALRMLSVDMNADWAQNEPEEQLNESANDLRNQPIYTTQAAWNQYEQELNSQSMSTDLSDLSTLAGIQQPGNTPSMDTVTDVPYDDAIDSSVPGTDDFDLGTSDDVTSFDDLAHEEPIDELDEISRLAGINTIAEANGNMNTYEAFYDGKKLVVQAKSFEQAQKIAASKFGAPKSTDVSVFSDDDQGVEVNEAFDEDEAVGTKKKSSTGGTLEKTNTGVKHTAKRYGGQSDDQLDEGYDVENEAEWTDLKQAIQKARESLVSDEDINSFFDVLENGGLDREFVIELDHAILGASTRIDVTTLNRGLERAKIKHGTEPRAAIGLACNLIRQALRGISSTQVKEERDIEHANTPREKTAPVSAVTTDASGGLNGTKKQYKKEYPGDNPMAVTEATAWDKYNSMLNDLLK